MQRFLPKTNFFDIANYQFDIFRENFRRTLRIYIISSKMIAKKLILKYTVE